MTTRNNDPNATYRDFFEPLDNAKEHLSDMAMAEDMPTPAGASPQPIVAALNHADTDDPTTRRRNRSESRRQDALYRNARRVYETDRD